MGKNHSKKLEKTDWQIFRSMLAKMEHEKYVESMKEKTAKDAGKKTKAKA